VADGITPPSPGSLPPLGAVRPESPLVRTSRSHIGPPGSLDGPPVQPELPRDLTPVSTPAYIFPAALSTYARYDKTLSAKCVDGTFKQKLDGLIFARIVDPDKQAPPPGTPTPVPGRPAKAKPNTKPKKTTPAKAAKAPLSSGPRGYGVIFPGGTNLDDRDNVGDLTSVYFFYNQGTTACEVWSAPAASLIRYRYRGPIGQ
jgi:hypothetical protein